MSPGPLHQKQTFLKDGPRVVFDKMLPRYIPIYPGNHPAVSTIRPQVERCGKVGLDWFQVCYYFYF